MCNTTPPQACWRRYVTATTMNVTRTETLLFHTLFLNQKPTHMKAVFLALFLLPLFATAQTTTDQNRYGKIELLWAHPPGSGVMSQASAMITNVSKQTLFFYVSGNGISTMSEPVLLTPGQVWQVWFSPWWGQSMTMTIMKEKNGKQVPGDPLYIDVPPSFPDYPSY